MREPTAPSKQRPEPVAIGEPEAGYPLPWSIQTWVPGTTASETDASTSDDFAHDLAEFIRRVRSIDVAGRTLAWGAVGLVATMCLAAFTINLLPKLLAGIGAVLVAGTVALSPTDHGGVSLSLLLWLIAANIVLLARKQGPISR